MALSVRVVAWLTLTGQREKRSLRQICGRPNSLDHAHTDEMPVVGDRVVVKQVTDANHITMKVYEGKTAIVQDVGDWGDGPACRVLFDDPKVCGEAGLVAHQFHFGKVFCMTQDQLDAMQGEAYRQGKKNMLEAAVTAVPTEEKRLIDAHDKWA